MEPTAGSKTAAKLTRPVTERLRKIIEREAFRLLERGVPQEHILLQICEKYRIKTQKKSQLTI